MTLDEYIADIKARRDAFRLRLEVVMASAIPSRAKTARIRAITREIVDLKDEVILAVAVALRP